MDPSPSPWEEALDIDDSDLSPTPLPLSLSVLRPCRQRLHHQTQVSLPPPQNQNPPHPLSSSSFSCRLIPGPAGAVQAAMHRRRNFNSGNFPFRTDNNTNCNNPISTQEYFRRIDYDSARDDDFTSNSWVLANDFVRSQCKVDGVSSSTPLDSVKKCPASDRVPLVVAIIQSSTPNGLGDLMITLKDPTGTIGATIHRKVLSQEEFAKDISVGAVMILQKVATFSPSRTAHYLNITLNNVIKVISKDSGRLSKPNSVALVNQTSRTVRPQEMSDLTEGMIGEAANKNGQDSTSQRVQFDQQIEDCNATPRNDSSNGMNQRKAKDAMEKENVEARQQVAKRILKAVARVETTENIHEISNCFEKQAEQDHHQASSTYCSSANESKGEGHGDLKKRKRNDVSQEIPPNTRVSLPKWTDEQLGELLVSDCEDDGCMSRDS